MRFSWKTLLKGLGKCWKFKKSRVRFSFLLPKHPPVLCKADMKTNVKTALLLTFAFFRSQYRKPDMSSLARIFCILGLFFLIIYLFIFLLSDWQKSVQLQPVLYGIRRANRTTGCVDAPPTCVLWCWELEMKSSGFKWLQDKWQVSSPSQSRAKPICSEMLP